MNDKDREPKIHPTAIVDDTVELGDWSVIHAGAKLYGDIKIGRAAWITDDVIIGGGQKELGALNAGDFLHMGIRSFINIADTVEIGDGVGLGMETKLFTHGGYLNQLWGFPFQRGPINIGYNVWLPSAIILPNVTIGNNVIVSAMSLVNKNIPQGCLAGGIPAIVLKTMKYPKLGDIDFLLTEIRIDAKHYGIDCKILQILDEKYLDVDGTRFLALSKMISGRVTDDTERVKDIFRRHGIRFKYYDNGGEYTAWD